jgi:hypothetical protein
MYRFQVYSLRKYSRLFILINFYSTLTQRILAQLKEELNGKTEKYYQTFAVDLSDTSNSHDGSYSAE